MLLRGREGWRPETEDGEGIWCLGLHGAARVVITPEAGGFLMFVHERDESWVIPRLELVEAWLDENEQDYAGMSPTQVEWKEAYERARAAKDGGSPAGGGPGSP